MAVRLIILLSLHLSLLSSCYTQKMCDQTVAEGFINKLNLLSIAPLDFVGFTMEKRSENHELIRPIQFTDQKKRRVNIRITNKGGIVIVDSLYFSSAMRKVLSQETSISEDSILTAVNKRIHDFTLLQIMSVRSSKHLGDYVEFILNQGCSLWYFPPSGRNSSSLRNHIPSLQRVRDHWYLSSAQ